MSLISVPWFVCLFVNILPFPVALRALDLFFVEGVKFMFWLGLAILKSNQEALLKCNDDDQVMKCLRSFFSFLAIRPDATAEQRVIVKKKIVDLFTQAYQHASAVNWDVVEELRNKYRLQVVQKIEDNFKKGIIRNLKENVLLSLDEIQVIYDCLKRLQFFRQATGEIITFEDFVGVCLNILPWRAGDRKGYSAHSEDAPSLIHRYYLLIEKIIQVLL